MTTPYVFGDFLWEASTKWRSTVATREADAKAWWGSFRNSFRSILPGASWKVGDIFRWAGTSTNYGHGFVIRNTVLNHEWLVIGSADSAITNDAAQATTIINQASFLTYFRRDGAFYNSLSSNFSGIGFMHNPDASVSWNIGYDVNLNLSGGDWTAPTSNPFTALPAFMSATKAPYAMFFNSAFCSVSALQQYFHVLIDEEIGEMRIDFLGGSSSSDESSPTTKGIFLSGLSFQDFADNGLDDPGDTNKSCQILQIISQGSQSSNPTSTNERGGIINNNCMYLSAAGARVDGTLEAIKSFTIANYATAGSPAKPKARRVEVRSAGVTKGYLDPRIALEAFPYKNGRFWSWRIYTSDPDKILVCEHESVCFMWPKTLGVYPYGKASLPS